MTQMLSSNYETVDDVSLALLSKSTYFESTVLIWFDPNIGSHEDTAKTKQQLCRIHDNVIFVTDLDRCVTLIQSNNAEKIFLILSGSKAGQILSQTPSCRQIDSIFIFCMKKHRYENLLNEYAKIIGIFSNLNDLCLSIKRQIDLNNKQTQTFSIYDQEEKSIKRLTKDSAAFISFQLFKNVISSLPRNEQSKKQMIQICKQYYRRNTKEMTLIEEFEKNYQSRDAIRWYSKQSFVYKLINKALRTEDTDLLYTFRFFINDLSENLKYEHEKILMSDEIVLNVYRGVKLDKKEFDKLKENQGKVISANGYLSTSRNRSLAVRFAMKPTKRRDTIRVLFDIQCDLEQLDKNTIFADISEFSQYPREEEVLFDLNACFVIESIEEQGPLQIIKMNLSNEVEKITKDYLKLTQNETGEINVSIIFGRLLCDLGEYDKSQKYFEQLLNDSIGEDRAWIEFNIGRALHFKGQLKEARKYFVLAYDQMMKNKPTRIGHSAQVLNQFGNILSYQGKRDEALDYHHRALKMREEFYPFGHVGIATSLSNIGLILKNQGKYDEALDCHRKALKILEEFYPPGHVEIARNFNNIGRILDIQGNYNEALSYHKRALKIYKKFYPAGHANIARSFNNIGRILNNQGKYDEALVHHQRALKLRDKCYPSGHMETAQSFNNIGLTLKNQGKYDEALDYHQRALQIQEKFYPSGHVDIAGSLNSIGICYENQNNQKMALQCYQRALTMHEKFLSIDHPDRKITESYIRRHSGKN
ncbi:unnamed protein product [Rotaria socialis]|uniref:Kinesin light chain n=1 Tax=Rotaria socialis TaxID=392032 RepID=A0A821JVR0_9BILA|nr:unnamed protein product [Rotaria socialis]CAF4725453.1 unnamed protein product [Rotaria socialis]